MRTQLILIVLLVSQVSYAQDWLPFKSETTYYYTHENSEDLKITWLRLNSTYAFFFDPVCFGLWYFDLDPIQSLSSFVDVIYPLHYWASPDSLWLFYYYDSEFEGILDVTFKANAKLGDKWQSNGLQFVCTQEDTMSFLGLIDSVRVMRCTTNGYDSLKFVLSKSHGFVVFPDLHNFYRSPNSLLPENILIGVSDSINTIGYNKPLFDDFFDLHPDDVLYSKDILVDYLPVTHHDTFFYIDTLIDVKHLGDTITYVSRRGKFTATGVLDSVYTITQYYKRSIEGVLINGTPGWLTPASIAGPIFSSYAVDPLRQFIDQGDTLTEVNLKDGSFYYDPEGCDFGTIFDIGSEYSFIAPIGNTYKYSYWWSGYHYYFVIGSIVNGKTRGITELPSATHDLAFQSLIFYPNPTADVITFDTESKYNTYEILDIQGHLLRRSEYTRVISVSEFQAGMYIIRLSDSRTGQCAVGKVVKM